MDLRKKPLDAKDIRRLVRTSDLYLYQVADEIGITEPTMTRWLRRLDKEKTERIVSAIEQLKRRGDLND